MVLLKPDCANKGAAAKKFAFASAQLGALLRADVSHHISANTTLIGEIFPSITSRPSSVKLPGKETKIQTLIHLLAPPFNTRVLQKKNTQPLWNKTAQSKNVRKAPSWFHKGFLMSIKGIKEGPLWKMASFETAPSRSRSNLWTLLVFFCVIFFLKLWAHALNVEMTCSQEKTHWKVNKYVDKYWLNKKENNWWNKID